MRCIIRILTPNVQIQLLEDIETSESVPKLYIVIVFIDGRYILMLGILVLVICPMAKKKTVSLPLGTSPTWQKSVLSLGTHHADNLNE